MKLLLFSTFLFVTCNLNAQEILDADNDISDLSPYREIYFKNNHIRFKDYGETWFSTATDLVNIGEIPPLSTDPSGQKALLVSIFPDSTIILGSDPSTNLIYRPSVHGIADIINPSKTPSEWVDKWADVLIDSIVIPFVYTRASNDIIVDTMFVDYIKSKPDNLLVYYDLNKNENADFGEFLHQPLFHTNLGSNKLDAVEVFRTDTILLTPADSSFPDDYGVKYKGIDVNDLVLQSDRYGVYIRFSPGYEWNLDDTINDYNELFLLAREQKEQELPRQIWPLSAGFCSYTMTSNVRYNEGVNSNYLISGIYPMSSWRLEHLIVSYKLTSNQLSINEFSNDLFLKLYPNPVDGVLNISFSVKNPDNLEIFIFDITGKQIFSQVIDSINSQKHFYSLNTEMLTPGIYSIKIGDRSEKFIVK
jgi:hypothetical protein